MLRIAYITHKGDTMGGFPQHTEQNITGFKKLGHEVDFFFLDYRNGDNRAMYEKKMKQYKEGTLMKSGKPMQLTLGAGTGYYYEPEAGWIMPVTPYKSFEEKADFVEKLETYDAVFWHTPFWFKQKPTLTDTDWPMLLDLKNPVNIAFVHDANLRSNGAWQYHIMKYFDRIINVHPASYNSCAMLEVDRVLIFNPQDLSKVDRTKSNFHNIKETGICFSLQNWKSSKHVDDLLRAVPHLNDNINVWAAGHGIEARYMWGSKEKMKPQHYSRLKDDPDMPAKIDGLTIAEAAETHPGFRKLWWLTEPDRDFILENTAFFIDTAWYTINRELGSHFSRVIVEAMMFGIVPIARDLGLSNNVEGIGEVFVAGENYVMIPHDATPKEFAEIVEKAYAMPKEEYERIVKNNYKLLEHFDSDYVMQQYINVIYAESAGWFEKYGLGEPTEEFLEKADKQWFGTGDKRTFKFERNA